MATEIGTLIVELRANSAQFNAEMDNARKGLTGVSTAGHSASAGVTHFAVTIARELIPGLEITTRELTTLIRTATTATGILGTLGKAALLGGGAVGGFALGNIIRNFVDELQSGRGLIESFKLATGSVKEYEEATRKAGEEQKKFLETIQATQALLRKSAQDLAAAQGKGEVGGFKLAGQDERAAKAARDAAIKDLAFDEANRRAALTKQFNDLKIDSARRAQLESELGKTMTALRTNVELDYQQQVKKIREDATKQQFALWKDETELLINEFQKRLKFRQEFEANLGQGGVGGGQTTVGLGATLRLSQQVEKDARDLAGARKLGLVTDKQYFDAVIELQNRAFQEAQNLYDQWAAFPAVEQAITVAVDRMRAGFGPLGQIMQDAATSTDKLLDSNQQLEARQAGLQEQFARMPQVTGQAAVAVQKLANDYNDLAWQAAGATQQIYAAAQAMVYFHSVGG